MQGEVDFPRFRQEFNRTAGGAVPLGDPQPAEPLASFECADVWVDHPYRDGVALVGHQPNSNDPSWGHEADRAAAKLARLGRKARKMIGGVEGWKDEGFDLATG